MRELAAKCRAIARMRNIDPGVAEEMLSMAAHFDTAADAEDHRPRGEMLKGPES